jgi:hypothetical protein
VKAILALLLLVPLAAQAQDKAELVGQLGGRSAFLVPHSAQRPDGGLREVVDEVKLDAERCARQCASPPQPLLVDRRGNCRVLRPEGS